MDINSYRGVIQDKQRCRSLNTCRSLRCANETVCGKNLFLFFLLLFDQIYNFALETLAQLSLIRDMLYIFSYTEQQHFGLLL